MEHYATAQQVFVGGLIFARLGAIVMLIPGIGETFIPALIRLALAFVMTLALYPLLAQGAPVEPGTVGELAGAIIKEALIGLMIGGILRLFMNALAVCGEIVSLESTLSFAQTANPAQAQPTASLSTFLNLLGLVLIMVTDLHHLFISVRSYQPTFMYRALMSGDVDVISAFSSDGRIAADRLLVLSDPKGAIPPYDAVVLISPQRADDVHLRRALKPLIGGIPIEAMRAANLSVDRDKRTPAQAAQALEAGLASR